MSAVIAPNQCPIVHATSAADSAWFSINIVEEIGSMVAGIHALADLPTEDLTIACMKKRLASIQRLTQLAATFTDERRDVLLEVREHADEVVSQLKLSSSECWTPVGSSDMPPFELTVVAWDGSRGKPCAVWLDPDADGWNSQEDGRRFDDGAITHWRYCNTPDDIASDGVKA